MYICTSQILCNEWVESLLNVKKGGVSGGKDGMLHMRASVTRWGGNLGVRASLLRPNDAADRNIQNNALHPTRLELSLCDYHGCQASDRSEG